VTKKTPYDLFVSRSKHANGEKLAEDFEKKEKYDCHVLPDEQTGNGTSREITSDSSKIAIIPQTTHSSKLPTEFSTEIVSVAPVPNEENFFEITNTDCKKDIYIKTTRRALLHKLYAEAKERTMVENLNVDTTTFGEQSSKYCCCSCYCEVDSCFSIKRNTCKVKFDDLTTPLLRRGRAQGWIMYKRILSPLFEENYKVVWLLAQLIVSLLIVSLSSLNLSISDPHTTTLIIFASSVFWSVLTFIDAAFVLWKWARSRKCCIKRTRGREESTPATNTFNKIHEENNTNDEAKGTATNELSGRELLARNVDNLKSNLDYSVCQGVSDTLRIILNEIFTYILIICSMVDSLLGQGKTTDSKIGIALLTISGMCMLFFVYVPKVVLFWRAIKNVQAVSSLQKNQSSTPSIDSSVSTKLGLYYQLYLFVHVALNMLVQIVLIVVIGGKITYDNKQYFDKSMYNDQVTTSGHLWCMIVTGYFIPVVGTLTVFTSTFYWIQEFLIGLCLNLVHILELAVSRTSDATSLQEIVDVINTFLRTDRLKEDYQSLKRKKIIVKCLYPLRTPTVVVISLSYAALVLAFVISAGVSTIEGSLSIQILNGGGWVACYILAILLLLAANLYTTLIACIWVVAILACFIIAITLFICLVSGISRWCCAKKYQLYQ